MPEFQLSKYGGLIRGVLKAPRRHTLSFLDIPAFVLFPFDISHINTIQVFIS